MEFNINELIDRVARGETPQEVLENVKNADVDTLIERVIDGESPESVLATVNEQGVEALKRDPRVLAVSDKFGLDEAILADFIDLVTTGSPEVRTPVLLQKRAIGVFGITPSQANEVLDELKAQGLL